jgi:hypothetical protein
LWLALEEKIRELGSHHLAEDAVEETIRAVASSLDEEGWNLSRNAGNMLALREAVAARNSVGRPLLKDLEGAFHALTLDHLRDPYLATSNLLDDIGQVWPALKESRRRPHLLEMVEGRRLDLLVAKARELGGDAGVRLLIQEDTPPETIVARLGIAQADYDRVLAEVKAERAERVRVKGLLKDVVDKPEAERIRHLITSDVSEELISEIAGAERGAIEDVKRAMEAEIAEKRRLEEEAAARKAAEAAGPALEDIPPDEMLEHIESLREILEFSDVEKEIRVMCEQSRIPTALVDIALSDPDRLDELEAEAEG